MHIHTGHGLTIRQAAQSPLPCTSTCTGQCCHQAAVRMTNAHFQCPTSTRIMLWLVVESTPCTPLPRPPLRMWCWVWLKRACTTLEEHPMYTTGQKSRLQWKCLMCSVIKGVWPSRSPRGRTSGLLPYIGEAASPRQTQALKGPGTCSCGGPCAQKPRRSTLNISVGCRKEYVCRRKTECVQCTSTQMWGR